MAIRKSAAGAIHQLIAELGAADAAVREGAVARLSVIGERAVSHLLDAFRASPSGVARAHMLQVIESTHDGRGLSLALDLLASRDAEPVVAAAAVHLLGTFLEEESTEALEALGAIALDEARPEAERLSAWGALSPMPARILAPLRKRLGEGSSAALRAAVAQDPGTPQPGPSLQNLVDAVLSGLPADPSALAEALRRAPVDVPVPTLHELVGEVGSREHAAAVEADRSEWVAARAAVHEALAARGSRVALYDVRDTIASASGALPGGFLRAAALVGEAACLESIAEALARIPARLDRHEQEWRDELVEAGRAIISRERLTRRQAVARRLTRKHPDVARVLFARGSARSE